MTKLSTTNNSVGYRRIATVTGITVAMCKEIKDWLEQKKILESKKTRTKIIV